MPERDYLLRFTLSFETPPILDGMGIQSTSGGIGGTISPGSALDHILMEKTTISRDLI